MIADNEFDHVGDSFCIYPFLELEIAASGWGKICCSFQTPILSEGKPMSVYEHSLEEIWNSEMMRSIRRQMVDGAPVAGCAYCYRQKKNKLGNVWEDGITTWTQGYLNPRNESIDDLKSKSRSANFAMPAGPERLQLEVGSLCNLKCRMCHGGSSSQISADPVQSRWTQHLVSPSSVRWKGSKAVVGPMKVLGVRYSGLRDVDWAASTPVAWTDGAASIVVEDTQKEASAVSLTISKRHPDAHPIRIEINGNVAFDGPLTGDTWTRVFELGDGRLVSEMLSISIQSPLFHNQDAGTHTGVGIQEVALTRPVADANTVAFARYSRERPWFGNGAYIRKSVLYDPHALTGLRLQGGEPMLIEQTREIMAHLISSGAAKNIELSFTTNGTVMDEEWAELARQFKRLVIAVSVEGCGVLNDYIRHQSNWAGIVNNIAKFRKLANAYVYVHTTVQSYNILHISEIIDFCNKNYLEFRYYFLEEPGQLNGLLMPPPVRSAAASRLKRFATRRRLRLPNECQRNNNASALKIASALEGMTGSPSDEIVRKFMIYTNDLDRTRNQSFTSVGSELISLLSKCGYPWVNDTRFARLSASS